MGSILSVFIKDIKELLTEVCRGLFLHLSIFLLKFDHIMTDCQF